jgi:coiled-coil domain-containing protein 130
MIAKGVRFNSEKKKAGRYLGTLIYQFTMPCPHCKNTMIIKTDPQSCEYLLVSGCIKYAIEYDEEKIDTYKIQTPEEGEKLNKNAFFKLETQKADWLKGEDQKPILYQLIENKEINKDDFYINQTLRRKLKMEKNIIKLEEEESKFKGLDLKLLPKNQHDKVILLIVYHSF